MPLLEFKCSKCGYETEELIKADGKYPNCPKCGQQLEQKYSGKLTVNYKNSCCGCSGNCSSCGGCH